MKKRISKNNQNSIYIHHNSNEFVFLLPLSASSSFGSVPKSWCTSFNLAKSSEVCVSNGFVGGIFGGNGAGSKGTGASSASRNVDTTAWWNSNKSSPNFEGQSGN